MSGQGEGLRLEPRASVAERCPYCRDALAAEPTCACETCGTMLHARCRAEHGGCTTRGCAGAAPSRPTSPVANAAPGVRETTVVHAAQVSETRPRPVAVRAREVLETIRGPAVSHGVDVSTTTPDPVAEALRGLVMHLLAWLGLVAMVPLGLGIVVGGSRLVRHHGLPPAFEMAFVVAGVLSPLAIAIAAHGIFGRRKRQ